MSRLCLHTASVSGRGLEAWSPSRLFLLRCPLLHNTPYLCLVATAWYRLGNTLSTSVPDSPLPRPNPSICGKYTGFCLLLLSGRCVCRGDPGHDHHIGHSGEKLEPSKASVFRC